MAERAKGFEMFTPWVGPESGNSKTPLGEARLLVLGESHYSDHHELGSYEPGMTLDVVARYRTGERERWMRTFDNLAAAIAGSSKRLIGREGVNSIWEQIAFYNYVPVVAASGSRTPPSEAHFALGAPPFEILLENLRPHAILVCGYRLWARFIPRHASDYTDNVWKPSTPFALIGEQKIPALRMAHPSTGYSPSFWTPHITELLDRANVQK